MTTTDFNITQVIFNEMSESKYKELKDSGLLSNQEFYITPEQDIVQATEEVAGIAEITSNEEVLEGVDDTKMVTPLKLQQKLDTYQTLPKQQSHTGKYLKTDGTNAFWDYPPSNYVTDTKLSNALNDFITADNIIAGANITLKRDGKNVTISNLNSYTGGGSGGFDSANYYTKAESNTMFANKSAEHTHTNKLNILDLFALNNGVLTWNGFVIPINPLSIEEMVEGNFVDEEIFNVLELVTNNAMTVITRNVFYMTNTLPKSTDLEDGVTDPNTATIKIYNNDYLLDTVILPPSSTQGYQLPEVKGIRIVANGNITSQMIISGYGDILNN